MSSPLVMRLVEHHGYPLLTTGEVDDFLARHHQVVLFFTENPRHFPESDDVAVILPELMARYAGRLTAAVIHRDAERELHRRYNFKGWPSLVFLRDGAYLGVITRVRDWLEYIAEFEALLAAPARPAPRLELPVAAGDAPRPAAPGAQS